MTDKLTAILVDDEINARENLRYLVEKFCPKIHIIAEAKNVDEAIELIDLNKPKIVFLDIEMPNKNGFELLKHYNQIDFHVIFVTAYDKYAINAFQVSAVDYLLKPIDVDRLKEAVLKVCEHETQLDYSKRYKVLKDNTQAERLKKIYIPYKSDYAIINIEDIIVIEANRMYSNISVNEKTSNKKYLYAKKLRQFDTILNDYSNFLRVHRSWMINTNFIKSYSKKDKLLLLKNDMKIPVSKSHKDTLEIALGFH
jgi:two-component system LytT family response regulator